MEGWGPSVVEGVEADAAEVVDVGGVDFCAEEDLGRDKGVVPGEVEFQ